MSSDKLSHEFEALQRMYGEQYGGADRERRAVAAEAVFRRLVAYGFKLAAVLGGIAVASGLNEQQAHRVGIGITVVVGLDLVFSNHKRLLVTAKAAHAYRWSLSRLAIDYNLGLKKALLT
ncbi:MAG: hypothetical protein RLZZ450_6335 [Pseudomonadota bacterium]|jgi:hypothetical protein